MKWCPSCLPKAKVFTEWTDDTDAVTLDRIDACLVPTILFVAQQSPPNGPQDNSFDWCVARSQLLVGHVGDDVSNQVLQ
jgi:hypothetical protein